MYLPENVKLHIWLAFLTPFSFLLDSAELEFDTLSETLRPMISTTPWELIINADSSLVPDL